MTTQSPHPALDGVTTSLDLDYSLLDNSDEYALYFKQLAYSFGILLSCYTIHAERGGGYESEIVASLLSRMLHTVEALRLKYTYNSEHRRPLWVDLSESGYPNSEELSAIAVDISTAAGRLQNLPTGSILKQTLLDHIFHYQKDCPELLEQLSERAYLEFLQSTDLFLGYTPGELSQISDSDEYRTYAYSWGCYDQTTNRPYLHLMTFEQSKSISPLLTGTEEEQQFLNAMKTIGSRAPDVGVLALTIDDALETIHPKILKRICVGPMYSHLLLRDRVGNDSDPREEILRQKLLRYAKNEADFLLFFDDEIVFSKRQQLSRSIFSPNGRVREIFAIEETDPECYERRASVIHHSVLLPHSLLQHISTAEQNSIPGFSRAKKMTFDEGGQVHGI
jgi:hypothetical protein